MRLAGRGAVVNRTLTTVSRSGSVQLSTPEAAKAPCRLHAFNVFVAERFRTHAPGSPKDAMRALARDWRALDADARAQYTARAEDRNSGLHNAMPRTRRRFAQKALPHLTPYLAYVEANHHDTDVRGATAADTTRNLAAKWRELPAEKKEFWVLYAESQNASRSTHKVLVLPPKASPSAYQLFRKATFSSVKGSKHTERLSSVDCGSSTNSPEQAALWRNLSPEGRQPWRTKAAELRAHALIRAKPAPKRLNAYHMFLKEHLKTAAGAAPLIASCAEQWRALGLEGRRVYARRADEWNARGPIFGPVIKGRNASHGSSPTTPRAAETRGRPRRTLTDS